MLLAVTFTARGMGVEDIRQVQTASFITLVMMGLWNLAAVARPFNRARVLLFGALLAVFFAALFVPILVEYHQFVTVLPHLLWTALGAALIEENAHRNRRWQKRNYPELEVAPLNFFPAK